MLGIYDKLSLEMFGRPKLRASKKLALGICDESFDGVDLVILGEITDDLALG